MSNNSYSVSLDISVYQLVSDLKDEIQAATVNDVLKFIIGVAMNKRFIDPDMLSEAHQQLLSYQHISQLTNLNHGDVHIRLRLDSQFKPYANNDYILAALMYLGIVNTSPMSVFRLSETKLNQLMQTHTA